LFRLEFFFRITQELGYMYPFTFIFGGTSKFLGVQSLTLHLGVQRKLTAFSPHKVVHHAVFCKLDKNMYTEKHLIELFNDHDYI
jgi:hypothetical protein